MLLWILFPNLANSTSYPPPPSRLKTPKSAKVRSSSVRIILAQISCTCISVNDPKLGSFSYSISIFNQQNRRSRGHPHLWVQNTSLSTCTTNAAAVHLQCWCSSSTHAVVLLHPLLCGHVLECCRDPVVILYFSKGLFVKSWIDVLNFVMNKSRVRVQVSCKKKRWNIH